MDPCRYESPHCPAPRRTGSCEACGWRDRTDGHRVVVPLRSRQGFPQGDLPSRTRGDRTAVASSLGPVDLDRQPPATLGATGIQHLAAILRRHASPEPVGSFALDHTRLVGTFHRRREVPRTSLDPSRIRERDCRRAARGVSTRDSWSRKVRLNPRTSMGTSIHYVGNIVVVVGTLAYCAMGHQPTDSMADFLHAMLCKSP